MSDTSDLDAALSGADDTTGASSGKKKDWRRKRRGRGRRPARSADGAKQGGSPGSDGGSEPEGAAKADQAEPGSKKANPWAERGQGKGRGGRGGGKAARGGRGGGKAQKGDGGGDGGGGRGEALGTATGVILIDKQKHGELRDPANGLLKTNQDVHVPPRLVQKHQLREGSLVVGPYVRSKGRHKFDLVDVETVDGMSPAEARKFKAFKTHTSIAPDFHYGVGDPSGDLSLRIIDLLCPVGRGQRGLLVAPPRSGKTMILQAFAKALEEHFPDVELMVLLVDERPEEATEWRRMIDPSQVFVSTNDETSKRHTQLCEAVFKRAQRMVELGKEVFLLVDSLTRMGRAYNNVKGNSGKTMSGGIDSRALEIPKQFFGLARNTETAGSLTILATALIETGSQMDKVIFEEFKGTGNMELVLSRKLADRRIFPAIDIERSGTRKEERLFSLPKLRQMHTLRRVLTRMHFAEAMELLVTKLDEVPTNADFLKRFEVDPDA